MKLPSQLRLSTRHVAPTTGISLSDKRLWILLLIIPVLLIIQLEMSWMHALEFGHNHNRFPTPPILSTSDIEAAIARSQTKASSEVERLLGEYEQRLVTKMDVQTQEMGEQKKSLEQVLLEIRTVQEIEANRRRPSHSLPPVNTTAATCGRQVDSGRLGVIEWVPRKGKYLVALCTGGQMSNRLMCIRQNMVNAAVLNRTLILPTRELDYDYSHLIDFDHFRLCFGNSSILSVAEYRALPESRGRIRFDSVLCHIRPWQSDTFCDELLQRFEKDIGAAFGTDKEILRPPARWSMKVGQLKKRYGRKAPIVGFANMFGVPLKDAPLNGGGGGPLTASPSCRGLLQPSAPIMGAARGFANTLLGNNFVAVHLRRGDFFQHCLEGDAKDRQPPCFLPIPQVAECLVSRLRGLEQSVNVIFLATDGEPQEIRLLEELVAAKLGRRVPLVELPPIGTQPWAKGLVANKLHQDAQVLAILTKSICGLAKEFYGSWTSTFSGDIHRLRDWWHTNTCKDSGICEQTDGGEFVQLVR